MKKLASILLAPMATDFSISYIVKKETIYGKQFKRN